MAKKDADLFDRLRAVGLRKQAARALSGVSGNAGAKAQRVARAAVAELRAVADEIERRLPAATSTSDSGGEESAATPRTRPTARRGTRTSGAQRSGPAKPRRAPRSPATAGAGRGSRSRKTSPRAPSPDGDARGSGTPGAPPAGSTESAAPTPDTAGAPPAGSTESAAPTLDTAESPPVPSTEGDASGPDTPAGPR
jgi:hypothetical protein